MQVIPSYAVIPVFWFPNCFDMRVPVAYKRGAGSSIIDSSLLSSSVPLSFLLVLVGE